MTKNKLMTREELRDRIISIAKPMLANFESISTPEEPEVEYDELTKFPELKRVIVDLLTHQFDKFVNSIEWVAPRPSTFRINLKNGQVFYIIYNKLSWIAQVESKKYYLRNLPEEQHAAEAIARILRYGKAEDTPVDKDEIGGGNEFGGGDTGGGGEETPEIPEI